MMCGRCSPHVVRDSVSCFLGDLGKRLSLCKSMCTVTSLCFPKSEELWHTHSSVLAAFNYVPWTLPSRTVCVYSFNKYRLGINCVPGPSQVLELQLELDR